MTEHASHSRLDRLVGEGIRAVVFDAVGTLIYAQPAVIAVYCDVIGRLGRRPVSELQVRSVLKQWLTARNDEEDLTTDEASERKFWFGLIAEIVADGARQQGCFDALYDHFGCPENWRCYQDVAPTLALLNQRGVRLAIASNFDARLHRVCRGLTALEAVSERIISSEAGWRKPARQFFDIVCQRVNCRPEEILFVGDDPRNDIRGARSAGLPAALIDRRGEPAGAVDISASPASKDGIRRIRSLSELC